MRAAEAVVKKFEGTKEEFEIQAARNTVASALFARDRAKKAYRAQMENLDRCERVLAEAQARLDELLAEAEKAD